MKFKYPKTKKIEKIDNYHGTNILDLYQWLEEYSNPDVKKWINEQEKVTHSFIDNLSQKTSVQKRLGELRKYSEMRVPLEALKDERIFFSERNKDDEKWIFYTKKSKSSKKVELINPNKWAEDESLNFKNPSADGKYLVFGKDKGGDENFKIYVMEVETKKILKDSVTGRKQRNISWLHDNSGFYYSRRPLKGQVKAGEEYYWEEVYFHELGTLSSEDKKIFFHKNKKEYHHTASVSEDGNYVVFHRNTYGRSEVYFKKIDSNKIIPIIEGLNANYKVKIIKNKIMIKSDLDAPNRKIFITDIDKPKKKNWKELIPESEDRLNTFNAIAGNLYLNYLHKAHSKIKIFSLKGEYIKDLKFPGIGSGFVQGRFSKPDIWVIFQSFLIPKETYKYNFNKNKLDLFFKPKIKININSFNTNQIEYTSKDGTKITMFLLTNKNIKKDGKNPVLLTGYGGFDHPKIPCFSPRYTTWLEAGGIIAIPNLRGGGEYGKKWYESGKLDKKQNCFDDFISAAEWLINKRYTSPKKLAISGASNGGLLVGAVTVQRPELFRAVDCAVPLLDMLRYHKFSMANIWVTEYGNSENSKQFNYLYKYSPYHNIKEHINYPAILITTSENDARVHPMHALKMAAKLQEVNPDGEPILLLVRKDSGHCGGTTFSKNIEQTSEKIIFLMEKLGMEYPQHNI